MAAAVRTSQPDPKHWGPHLAACGLASRVGVVGALALFGGLLGRSGGPSGAAAAGGDWRIVFEVGAKLALATALALPLLWRVVAGGAAAQPPRSPRRGAAERSGPPSSVTSREVVEASFEEEPLGAALLRFARTPAFWALLAARSALMVGAQGGCTGGVRRIMNTVCGTPPKKNKNK